jgi:hypothetical protein
MDKGECVSTYLTQVAHVKDELESVGEFILDIDLVRIALKGFT